MSCPGVLCAYLGIVGLLPSVVFGAVDLGHFAVPLPYSDVGIPPFVNFTAPSNGAASYILSTSELGPPYASKTPLAATAKDCDMNYASTCSIQAAIDIVSRTKDEVSNWAAMSPPGGDLASDLMFIIFGLSIEIVDDVKGLGVFVVDEDFKVVVDWLRFDLMGQPLDGVNASGRSVQPRFRERVRWVTGNASGSTSTGGFVPHATTRLTALQAGQTGEQITPVGVSTYFEMVAMQGRVFYIGASVRRQASPAQEPCSTWYSSFCNIFNIQRTVGLALLDFLSTKDEDDYEKFIFELGYGEKFSVGDVTPLLAQVGTYPGLLTSVPLNPTYNTILASKDNPSTVGTSDSDIPAVLGPAAIQGGGWLKHPSPFFELVLGPGGIPTVNMHYRWQASLAAGVVFDNTAHALAAGFLHTPPPLTKDFECMLCVADFQPCALQTMEYLFSHGQIDFMLADNASDALWRITNLRWLGADHTNAEIMTIDNVLHDAPWPDNFTLAVFDATGNCVADGGDPTRIGNKFNERTVHSAAGPVFFPTGWMNLTYNLANGIGYLRYDDVQHGAMFAKIKQMSGFEDDYYLVSAIPSTPQPLGDCSLETVDPCVGEWIEAKMMEWITTLAVLSPSMWDIGSFDLMWDFPSGTRLWAGVYDAKWESIVASEYGRESHELTVSDIAALDAVTSALGGWVVMPNSTRNDPHKGFVLGLRINASLELRVAAGFVGKLGNVSCGKHGCGEHQYCDVLGWCQCETGYEEYRSMSTECANGFGETALKCDVKHDPVVPCPNMTDLENCNLCTPGNYCPTNFVSYPCPEGYYCPAFSRSPLQCPGGTWTSGTGARDVSDCFTCDPGTYRDSSSLSTCQPCPAGTYQNDTGKSSCNRCPVGTWQDSTGATDCHECRDHMTTDGTGYTSGEGCSCPANTYTVIGDYNETSCQSCGDGSFCAGFGEEPQALAGYYLHEINPWGLSIFRCSDSAYCPGGITQSCSAGRTGIACADCLDDMTPDVDGSCRDCVFADTIWLPFVFLIFAGALAVLYYRVSVADRSKPNHATLLIAICASQTVTMAQTFNVLATLQVEWRKPLSSFLAAFSFLAFDITELRVSCHVTANALDSYLLRLFVPVAALVFISILHVFTTAMWYACHFAARLPTFLGAVGSIFNAFCISVVLASLLPLQCMQHPNGLWTIYEAMSELCWEGSRHRSMVIAAAFACLLPISFLVAIVYILKSFPQKMREGDVRFLNTAQFLLFRYKPAARWCALFLICRNMLVAVIPVVPDPVYQVVLLQFISLAGLCVLIHWEPCRVVFANVSEVGICLLSLIAGSVAAFFLDDADLDIISQLAMAVIIAVVILFPVGITAGIILWVRQSKKKAFHFFLCHHKAGAGALARLLKMELCRGGGSLKGDVFVDSDNLDNLDKLFHFVAQETDTLVAISSAELYKRPWCVGEVTTAHGQQVRVVPLYLIDFVPPTDEFIQEMSDIVDLRCIFEQGIDLDSVQKALRWVRSLGGLTMPSSTDVRVLSELAKALFYRSTLSGNDALLLRGVVGESTSSNHHSTNTSDTRKFENKPPAAIIVDTANSEAMCSARILIDLLSTRSGHAVQALALLQDATANPTKSLDLLPSVHRLAMLCTTNCWSSLPFFVDAVHGYWTGLEMHPIVVDEGYRYPTEAFFLDLDSFGQRVCRQCEVPENPAALRNLVAMVFKNIASHFHVLGSMDLLHTQADGIARRLGGARATVTTGRQFSDNNEPSEDVRHWCSELVRSACTWYPIVEGAGASKRRLSQSVREPAIAKANLNLNDERLEGTIPANAGGSTEFHTGEESFDVDSCGTKPMASI